MKDFEYMQMALSLAERGAGEVEPNPAVGCVIVKHENIIGKGYHKVFAGPHAEIEALDDCRNNGFDPAGADMYVTLEPCCHYGKTGPCTEAIIKAGIVRVFLSMVDPSEHANGQGIEKLRQADIEVQTGLCEKEASELNAPFIKRAKTSRPWVIVKWAQSKDGYLCRTDDQRWISSEQSRRDAHKLRCSAQAILVGINTVLTDDPLLTARPGRGTQPLRIVLDSKFQISADSQLVKTISQADLMICTTKAAVEQKQAKAEAIHNTGTHLTVLNEKNGLCDLDELLDNLGQLGVQRLLVEGGAEVIDSFLKETLTDEVVIYIAPEALGSNGSVPISKSMAKLSKQMAHNKANIKHLGQDIRVAGFLM